MTPLAADQTELTSCAPRKPRAGRRTVRRCRRCARTSGTPARCEARSFALRRPPEFAANRLRVGTRWEQIASSRGISWPLVSSRKRFCAANSSSANESANDAREDGSVSSKASVATAKPAHSSSRTRRGRPDSHRGGSAPMIGAPDRAGRAALFSPRADAPRWRRARRASRRRRRSRRRRVRTGPRPARPRPRAPRGRSSAARWYR